MPRPKRYHACTTPGCPNLTTRDEPCPKHGRPLNASWSKDRDHQAHAHWRHQVLERDNHQCQRCGSHTNLTAHHIRPGYDVINGITLCETCHASVDNHARVRRA